jgi:hypothetical protein
MTTEIVLVRLPAPLSDLIDEAVDQFVEQHADERLQAQRRYHGADLWTIFRHEPVGEGEPAFLTRRVTIAAYSDDPDYLRFIPDIVVTRPEGRFMLQPNGSRGHMSMGLPPISVLQVRLALEFDRASKLQMPHQIRDSITRAISDAWSSAQSLEPRDATQLIP